MLLNDKTRLSLLLGILIGAIVPLYGQHTVARQWNEVLLEGIRSDEARPTVHARNLYHTSMALYDAWAAYDEESQPVFLGRQIGDFLCPFGGIEIPTDPKAAQEEAMSYAAYRLILHRFRQSPGAGYVRFLCENLMLELDLDTAYKSTDYISGPPAALGNYLALHIIEMGMNDGANEANDYGNLHYVPFNPSMDPEDPGNPDLLDPNRWQPLRFEVFIGQSGILSDTTIPEFVSPEWGQVIPFALTESDRETFERNGHPYYVYHDPGPPPYLEADGMSGLSEEYVWGFTLVALWSAHLDPADSVMWDISPASIGNIDMADYPTTIEALRDFYDELEGGDIGQGHSLNPHTGQPYAPQMVPRGDYARVLAEFWADGPDSETPPGHWFTILNYVNDHPDLIKRFEGQGEILDDLEWEVKSYMALGGAMHDAAISAWGIKGWYDYIRPVSALRYMADQGQRSDPNAPNYDPLGIPLYDGLIEIVEAGDPLAGQSNEHIGKIKFKGWLGPDAIVIPAIESAGVGWILAENWWPYQRPTFVTPPFAGYVSGHSTYSRAAAEVLTRFTGDPFFPGGMGEFEAEQNRFLVFEDGPSQDVILQWATYRDASDQTSLSRIWGGIHPPADDIPGRLIGEKIGNAAFEKAKSYFQGSLPPFQTAGPERLYPNPVRAGGLITFFPNQAFSNATLSMYDLTGRIKMEQHIEAHLSGAFIQLSTAGLAPGLYALSVQSAESRQSWNFLVE